MSHFMQMFFTTIAFLFGIIMAVVIKSEVIPNWKLEKDKWFYVIWISAYYIFLLAILWSIWRIPVYFGEQINIL